MGRLIAMSAIAAAQIADVTVSIKASGVRGGSRSCGMR